MSGWFRFRAGRRPEEVAEAPTAAVHGDDAAMLARLGEGDTAALEALYQRHGTAVYRFAYALSASRETAEEVTQEVFLFLFREWRRFDSSRGSLEGWLLGIARRKARKQSQSRWTVPLTGEEAADSQGGEGQEDVLGDLVRRQQQAWLHQTIAALPEPYRDALVMHALQGMPYEEVARVLGCPVGTVRSRIARAKAELGRQLRVGIRRTGTTGTDGEQTTDAVETSTHAQRVMEAGVREGAGDVR